ncbi:hypothetical protein [Rhizosaccharibacter radicis]|uniref:ATP synthase subunit b n=1 Tax=Rhizosaccharibacter radicis TaxID=2782605 RepID=A0ABT1VYW5_9PROT|nr:hypothetical protein [Acetobacteraceae bacterium KSS12]
MTRSVLRRLPSRILSASGALLALGAPRAFAAGMPQLDFGNPLTKWQVVWGAVIFAALYLLLSRSALPKVAFVLAERRGRIEADLDAAKLMRDQADAAIDALRRARHDAAAEANAIVDKVVAEARAQAATRNAEMNARLEAQIDAAERDVAESRARALASLPAVASDTAAALVERLLGHPVEQARLSSAVDAVLADRRAA